VIIIRAEAPVAVDETWQELLARSIADDRVFHERAFAAMALGATKGGEARLEPLLRDEDPRVVVAAIRGVATGPEERFSEALERCLRHPDALVRQTAADAVIAWKMTAKLREIAATFEGETAMRADLALVELGESEGSPPPPERGGDPVAEEWACHVAGLTGKRLPDPASLATPPGLRAAAEACGKKNIAEPEARKALLALLGDPDATVRAAAAGAVAERGFADLAPALVTAARTATGPEAPDTRGEVASALAKLKVADPWLRIAADDPAHPVRKAAREALEELGKPLPPERPRAGFRLHGLDAAGVVEAARALRAARVTLHTDKGVMTLVLLPDEAPAHCVNFAKLVKRGFYDGKTWHRVVADFVIQGGCPRGDGWGGPGYFLPDEIGTRPYVRGTVGMPKAGDDTGGCQLFITHLPTPHLDGRYTVFAQVVDGLAVIDRIRVGDRIRRAEMHE